MNSFRHLAMPAPRRVLSALFWAAAGIAAVVLLSAYVDALNASVRRGEDLRNAQRALAHNEREVAHARAL